MVTSFCVARYGLKLHLVCTINNSCIEVVTLLLVTLNKSSMFYQREIL
jgi:hypothetical protein